jgi:ubiquinone/menaquinone biosynthesis C-methylase UbiE
MDFSKISLAKLHERAKQKRLDNVEAVLGDAHHVPCRNGSVNIILCSAVLEHVFNPKEVMKELARITKNWVIISIPCFGFSLLVNLLIEFLCKERKF